MALHRTSPPKRLLRRKQSPRLSLAERYERDKVPLMSEPLAKLFLRQVRINRGDRVLDLACGTGIVARLAAPAVGLTGIITGLDISNDMLAVAQSKSPAAGASLSWKRGDAADLAFENETFDLVLSQQGFQYFSDQETALREMYRVLASGGRLALCFAQAVGPESQPFQWAKVCSLTQYAGEGAGQKAREPASFFRGNSELLRKMISAAGFVNCRVKDFTLKVQMGPTSRLIDEDSFPDLSNDTQMAVVNYLHQAMKPYANSRGIEIPFGMHLATALKE